MTRRYSDFRNPRSPDIGLTGWIIIACYSILIVAILALAACLLAPSARARDAGQWEASDPAIRSWYRSLMQPDNPNVPCCGESDAYWADEIVVEGDKVFAIITDTRGDAPLGRPHIAPGTRFEIPPGKYKHDRGNPTGHNVLFIGPYGGVYCFVQGSGA